MKVIKLILSASLLLFAATSHAVLIEGTPSPNLNVSLTNLIDFDDQPTGTPVGFSDYAHYGVYIYEGSGAGNEFARYSGSQSQPNYVGTGSGYETNGEALGWDGFFVFWFGGGVTNAIGIGVADSAGDPEVLSVYDEHGSLMESHVLGAGANTYWTVVANGIGYVSLSCDFCAFDDFQFRSVPEPGTLALLGLGLAGMGLFRRRQKI